MRRPDALDYSPEGEGNKKGKRVRRRTIAAVDLDHDQRYENTQALLQSIEMHQTDPNPRRLGAWLTRATNRISSLLLTENALNGIDRAFKPIVSQLPQPAAAIISERLAGFRTTFIEAVVDTYRQKRERTPGVDPSVTARRMRMLRLALAEPNLTHAEIATKLEEFGETESTVRDDIRSLRSEGLLELKKPGRKPVAITIREGVPVKDAADEHGVHPKTISRRRQAAGIPPARSPVPDIKRAEILADLADTSVPYWGVAEKHGVSPSTVTRIAKEADLPPRRRGSKSKE